MFDVAIDRFARRLTVFTGAPRKSELPPTDNFSAPLTIEILDPISARAIGLAPGGSLIARPDGHMVAMHNKGEPQHACPSNDV
jgi:hypothetical protein